MSFIPQHKSGALALLLFLVFLAFSPALDNQFVNWDDPGLVLENPRVQSLSIQNIVQVFRNVDRVKTYSPLTTLSFAIEHHFAGYNPFLYHLDNILLHLGVVILVFHFALKIGLSIPAAFLGSLLFGIHPIHVESVAWISERKDVLCALFYMAALKTYMDYLSTRRGKLYLATILFTLLSILAKPMAYSLPVALFLIDWFKGRTLNRQLFVEKVPHFVIIAAISLITYTSNSAAVTCRIDQVLLIWIWSFCFYIQKFVLPLDLSPVYHLPEPVDVFQPAYIAALAFFLVFLWTVFRLRQNRWFIFAALFYAVSISMIVIRSVWDFGNRTVVADRFMYLPSLGFCLLAGLYIKQLFDQPFLRTPFWQKIARFCLGGFFTVLITATMVQNNVWQDGVRMWSQVIKHNPEMVLAYVNRATASFEKGEYQAAMEDYSRAMNLDPKDPDVYFYRAQAYLKQNEMAQAITDYNKAIELNPNFSTAYFNLGYLYDMQGQYEQALMNYSMAIEADPEYGRAYNNRGFLYLGQKNYPLARKDFEKALAIDPAHTEALNNMGVVFLQQNQYAQAVDYFSRVIAFNPRDLNAYSNRAITYIQLRQFDLAMKDLDRIIVLDPLNAEAQRLLQEVKAIAVPAAVF